MSHPGLPYEPKVMKHPNFKKGKITPVEGVDAVSGRPFRDSQGEPDILPDVTVKDPTTEAYYRSRGYLIPGEVPPPPAEYSEYPVMLVHPEHVDAIPDDFTIEKHADTGEIIRHRIPGSPEKFPAMVANSQEDEETLAGRGYKRAGKDNPDAIRTSKASPYKPGRTTAEYPKMVNDAVVDPNAPTGGPIQYPKWVGDKLVNSRSEEMALLGPLEPAPAPVHVPAAADRLPLETTAREQRKAAREAKKAPKTKQPASEGAERQDVPAGE